MAGGKDPYLANRIEIAKGIPGNGIYMSDGATIVDENGNVVDNDPTFNDTTLTGDITVNGTSFTSHAAQNSFVATNDTANGAQVYAVHDSASPAAFDVVGQWMGIGNNDAAEAQLYGSFGIGIFDPTDGAEYGLLGFFAANNGSSDRIGVMAAEADTVFLQLGSSTSPNGMITTDDDGDIIFDPDGTGSLLVHSDATAGGAIAYQVYRCIYDFAVDGGSIGDITLADTNTLPDNFVATCVMYDVISTCTSSSDAATIALTVPTDGSLITAVAISDGSNPWDAGPHGAGNNGNTIKTTDARALQITVANEALTAGKIIFTVLGFTSE